MSLDPVETERIEKQAYDLLSRVPEFIWDGESLPVPVDDIVDSMLGLRIRLVDDMSKAPGCDQLEPGGVSGLLLTELGEIWVNRREAEQWEGRRRFTIGHEAGHYLIHRNEQAGDDANAHGRIFCRSGDIEDHEPRTRPAPKPPAELEADAFAAALLMPEHLIREHAAACDGDIEHMKGLFHCSHKAMTYRLFVLP